MTNDLLQSEIRRKLESLRLSIRRRLANEGVAWLLVAIVALVFITLGFDYCFRTDRVLRAVMMALAAAVIGYVVWRLLLSPMRVPMNLADLSLLVEKQYAQMGDRLISIVQFSQRPPEEVENASPAMLRRLADEAHQIAREVDFGSVVERRHLRKMGMLAVAAVLTLTLFTVWQQPVMAMWFQRNIAFADVDWPQDTILVVEGGPNFTVIRGEDLDVTVEARGVVPSEVLVHMEYESGERLQVKAEPVAGPQSRHFSKKIPAVDEPFAFYVTGGDDRRDSRHKHYVTVVAPPAMKDIRFRVEHMPYMNRPPGDSAGGRDVFVATPGSVIQIEGLASKDIASAALFVDDKPLGDMSVRPVQGTNSPRVVKGQFTVPTENLAASRSFKIALVATDSSTNRRERPYLVQVQPDLPPDVELKKHSVGAAVTPNAYIPLLVQLKDDYGISAVHVQMARKDAAVQIEPIKDLPTSRDFRLEHSLDLENYKPRVGDTIELSAQARDNMPAEFVMPATAKDPNGSCGPNTSRSGVIELRIIKPEDLMEELVRRQKELRVEFSEAVAMQESARAKTAAAAEAAQGGSVDAGKGMLVESGHMQTAVASQCAKAADTIAAIVAERRCNRLGTVAELDQMMDEVVNPLGDLGKKIADAIGVLGQVSAVTDAAQMAKRADAVGAVQAQIRITMDEILQRMIKIGSRQEAEKELLKLIERSGTVRDDIIKIKRAYDAKVFEPNKGSTTAPATGPGGERKTP